MPNLTPKVKCTRLNLPIALWFRGALRGWLHDLLSPQNVRARGLFDPGTVQIILAEHDAGRRDHSLFLWALIMLEVWQRMYLDGRNEDAVMQMTMPALAQVS